MNGLVLARCTAASSNKGCGGADITDELLGFHLP